MVCFKVVTKFENVLYCVFLLVKLSNYGIRFVFKGDQYLFNLFGYSDGHMITCQT